MKFFAALILTALLAYIAGIYLPWWSVAIAAFIVAVLVHQKAGKALLAGFLGVFLLWAGLAFWIDFQNDSILSKRIANLLPLHGNTLLLIVVTGLIGGLVAGLAL
jgi:hypothetical protein